MNWRTPHSGRRSGYATQSTVDIEKLRLHKTVKRNLDPIIPRLCAMRLERQRGAWRNDPTAFRSPVAMYASRSQPVDPHGRMPSSYFGPYMQYMSGVTDTQVKWTLENRSDNPGIADGDMCSANDPWRCAPDGRDAPVPDILGRRAVLRVTTCLHQYDLGGITPGSFCPSARDALR